MTEATNKKLKLVHDYIAEEGADLNYTIEDMLTTASNLQMRVRTVFNLKKIEVLPGETFATVLKRYKNTEIGAGL